MCNQLRQFDAIFIIAASACLAACSSPIAENAKNAEADGEIISNEMMLEAYPQTFQPGDPQYLERDFEAGADFICDEMKRKFERDVCSDPDVNWRR